ncbi:MAG: zinc ribbon domain-containing protein [Halobacteria archaeon]|nr:zinc ribbon domain-containing protein [Halobacteria archaeon]
MTDSKITFRVSDDLLDDVDSIDESRSEVMRRALRSYLGSTAEDTSRHRRKNSENATLDELISRKIDEAVERKLEERESGSDNDVNVTVNIPESTRKPSRGDVPEDADTDVDSPPEIETASKDDARKTKTCPQCGEELEESHVHCPNCGTKASQRVFCECGDELRSDWSFCPSCGRRTPTSHALQG